MVDTRQILRSWNDLAEAVVTTARAATKSLVIFTHNLDPQVFNQQEFLDEIKRLATTNRTAKVRILCMDSTYAMQDSHRLIETSRRLSSFVEIRAVGDDFRDREDAFIIADRRAIVHRTHAGRPDGFVDTNSVADASRLLTQFNHIWEYSSAEREFQRLHI
ncbi:MAG: hypothetical protein HKM24_04270 [Gammaproteobacteria bacterium]|nr:hypothetical protein [Gammaproteobacteria bacterium]